MGAVLCQVPPMPKIPTSRLGRTAKFGGLVAGQGARWAGTQAANRLRSDEQAAGRRRQARARARRRAGHPARADEGRGDEARPGAVDHRLRHGPRGRARGVQGEACRRCATTRRRCRSRRCEKVLDRRPRRVDRRALLGVRAGAGRGGLDRAGLPRRRCTTARDVAVKVQYPGVAEAVETDLRNAAVLAAAGASGWRRGWTPRRSRRSCATASARSSTTSWRPRTSAASRGRSATIPFIRVPDVVTLDVDPSRADHRVRRRPRLRARSRQLPEAERDRFAEICFRFFYGLLRRERIAAGDPHPGNYLLGDDGRVCFLDFGLIRRMDADYLEDERALARAVIDGDADAVHRGLATLGYLPDPDAFDPERVLGPAGRGRRVVLPHRLPAVGSGVRARRRWSCRARRASPLLRGDAPPDDPAAGAAVAAHGGVAVQRARRVARRGRLGRRWRWSTSPTSRRRPSWGGPRAIGWRARRRVKL